MATGAWPTLLDLTSRLDGAGKQMTLAEMLSQCNDVWDFLPVKEANEIGGHEFAFRTSLPAGFWRSINQGTPYSKSTSAKTRLGIGVLEDWSQVDRLLAEASGDIEAFRASEMVAFMEGMSQTMVQGIFYGNAATTPASFNGLSVFYNTVYDRHRAERGERDRWRRRRQLQPVHLVELLQPSLALLRLSAQLQGRPNRRGSVRQPARLRCSGQPLHGLHLLVQAHDGDHPRGLALLRTSGQHRRDLRWSRRPERS